MKYDVGATQILQVRSAGIIGMLIAPFGGRLAERFSLVKLVRSGLLIAAIGLFFIGISNSILILTLMSIIFTAGISVTIPSLIAFLGQHGGNEKSVAMSLYSFFLFVGSTIGPLITIFLMRTGNYVLTFSVISILLLLGLLSTFSLSNVVRDDGESTSS
ncbi:MFS transporter [Salipaludibacillus sp. CF4.18]|uniref:MFS transporter n=1 Tax=Salipaludibacillus sp. CF4.18 TaxID=3373081 RepID=UPI003EE5E084